MDIKAIETSYKDYLFRSRLEARWAVFFDNLNIAWEYEPEGYKMSNGMQYLPDFRLSNIHIIGGSDYPDDWIYFECKPEIITQYEIEKILNFVHYSKLPILLSRGSPGTNGRLISIYPVGGNPPKRFHIDDALILDNGVGEKITIIGSTIEEFAMKNMFENIFKQPNGYDARNTPRLLSACKAARSARFEWSA